ncbi:MAG: alpha/beta hydrolase [Atopobiaceae bacterium]|nr:alpha/beta hydrolase [Atopobiaceae bacterium]MBR3315706.1 alpha/beta hydrolase [Atopobiaceae bacterium]
MMPTPPEPHFPSRYSRPSVAPSIAMRVTTSDGAQIATFVYGTPTPEVTPVLMLHGNGEEHGIFGPIVDVVLEAGLWVVAVDSRAQGMSSRGSAPLTYELMTADAVCALDALGVARAHVLGFSDGGIEALLLGRDYPERVTSITALGANLTPEGVIEEPNWDIEGAVAHNHEWADYWHALDNSGEAQTDSNVDVTLLTPSPTVASQHAELLQLMLDEPHIEPASLSAIRCPTCIMVGEHDCIDPAETRRIVDAIPSARLIVVANMGHSLPKAAPDAVSAHLLATIMRTAY